MRFRELHLVRYGHFEDHVLEFSPSSPDLQVIYGANEAGKSTTMSAVTDLLFGFRPTTPYGYRFDQRLLRIGAVLEGEDGRLAMRRRKGNKGTLVDPNDSAIDEGPLLGLLAGQDRDSFMRMFSLDHERLREGGQAILEAEDDAGRVIFEAGSGLVGITKLAQNLDKEADAIWGQKSAAGRKYYAANNRYEEARAQFKHSQLKSARWAELKNNLEAAETALENARANRSTLQARSLSVERGRRILPAVASRKQLLDELSFAGDVPELPTDAATNLADCLGKISEAETALRLAEGQRKEAEAEDGKIAINAAVLAHRSEIAALRTAKGAADKAQADMPGIRARAQAGLAEIARLMSEIGRQDVPATEAEQQLPKRPQLAELRALLDVRTGLDAAVQAAEREVGTQRQAADDVGKAIAQLPKPVEPGPVTAVLRIVRGKGDIAASQNVAEQADKRARSALNQTLALLAPWQGDVEALSRLVLPPEAEIAALAQAVDAASRRLADEHRTLKGLQEEKARKELERQLLSHDHAVAARNVKAFRDLRDETWRALAGHLKGETHHPDPGTAADTLTTQIADADALADRRFESAKGSAELAGAERDIARITLTIAQAEERVAEAKQAGDRASAAWDKGLAPLAIAMTSAELTAWRGRRDKALELAATLAAVENELEKIAAAASEARKNLLMLSLNLGDQAAKLPLSMLLAAAEQWEADANAAAQRRAALLAQKETVESAQASAEGRHRKAEQDIAGWAGNWQAALARTGLDKDATPAAVRSQIEIIQQIGEIARTVAGFDQRIADMLRDITAFGEKVRETAVACGLAQDDDNPSRLLALLEAELASAQTMTERRNGLGRQITAATGHEDEARQAIESGKARLKPLLTLARVETAQELAPVIAMVDNVRGKRRQLEDATHKIVAAGDGMPLESLLAEVEGKNPASLAADGVTLSEELAQANVDVEHAVAAKSDAGRAFHGEPGSEAAAIAAADMEMARSEMAVQAEAYLRKRVEQKLLQWTIDRYRAEKQAPLLKRATAIFSSLTLGKYEALSVYLEDDRPMLAAVEVGGTTMVPASALSDGATDQLYLALRLAAVEEAVDSGLRLPFLCDDLFINYDSDRALAGLKALAALAQKTQVLFFTHHDHLLPIAAMATHPAPISTCQIGRATR
ncbi:MAG: hypothetical protein JWM91_5418 [Rhodospirillales bacterium]|nr:hypothetical protein [Rhodospirillales bacterium]